MSILDVAIRPDMVAFLTDSLEYDALDWSPRCFTGKVRLWPDIPAAGSFVGSSRLAAMVDAAVTHAFCEDAREAAEIASRAATRAVALDAQQHPGLYPRGRQGGGIVAGWLPSRQRFAGWWIGEDSGWRPVELEAGFYPTPRGPVDPPSWRPAVPGIVSTALMVDTAQRQHRLAERSPTGNHGTGGDLVLTRIDRKGITIKTVGQLPGRAELVRRMLEQGARRAAA